MHTHKKAPERYSLDKVIKQVSRDARRLGLFYHTLPSDVYSKGRNKEVKAEREICIKESIRI